ncbi:retinol-binding protein pinta-like [Zophobas morio]|uniref:retinol-binding protein pinta-like n=1 Tax=Zophobas morio TaxID=2755281 RepID=UPI003083DCC1
MSLHLADVNAEYEKNKRLKKEEVQKFYDWVNEQPHLPKINELQAILFLHACNYNEDAAKKTIDTFFTVKTMDPGLFKMRNPRNSPINNSLDVMLFTPLPQKTPEGYTIVLVKLQDVSPSNYNTEVQLKIFDMMCMLHLQQYGTSDGYVAIFDMKGTSFGHLFRTSPLALKRFLYYVQEGIPARLKRLHYMNLVSFMDKIMALMKPFMKKELYDIIYLHNTIDDLTKYVPLECLPKDYGGSAETVSELHEKMKKTLFENVDFFNWEDEQSVDESQRPKVKRNWFNWR